MNGCCYIGALCDAESLTERRRLPVADVQIWNPHQDVLRKGREHYGVARRPRDSATLPRGLSMVQICVPCEVMHEAMS
jgi:hypothetical protein